MFESYLFAACLLAVVGAALYIQARQYDKILKTLNSFQQIGIKVSMDKPAEKVETRPLSFTQKRALLEAAARKRALEKQKAD